MKGLQAGPVAHAHARDTGTKGSPHAVLLQGNVHGAGALVQQRKHGAHVQQTCKAQALLLTPTVMQEGGGEAGIGVDRALRGTLSAVPLRP